MVKIHRVFFNENCTNYGFRSLKVAEVENLYDIKINVMGGGFSGTSRNHQIGHREISCKINEDHKKPLKIRNILRELQREVRKEEIW